MRGAHDCFGSILVVEDGKVTIICAECPKACLEITAAEGAKLENRHSGKHHPNRVTLKALKIAIERVEKMGQAEPPA